MVAAYHLDKAAAEHKEQLAVMPYDDEVRAADAVAKRKKLRYRQLTKWEVLPNFAKATLIVSIILMVLCCYLVQLYSTECFEEYELTDKIRDVLDSKWYKLIKWPLGYVATFMFLASCLFYVVFQVWASRMVTRDERMYPDRELEEDDGVPVVRRESKSHMLDQAEGESGL